MPPRASKRQRSAVTASAEASTSAQATAKPLGKTTSLTIGIPNTLRTNETTDLPVELFYEILSYFETVPFDVMPPENSPYYLRDADSLGRQDALRVLSQISRSWRAFFLPLAWESLELAAIRTGNGQWHKQTSENLIEVGNGLARTPHIAQHVRNIRVVMSQSKIDKTMPAFVSALKACSNLKTVNVFFAHADTGKHFKKAFENLSFPSVEALVIPKQAHHILKTCPNVKKVFCTRGDGSQLITALGSLGKQLELIAGIKLDDKKVKKLVKAAPNLKELRVNGYIPLLCQDLKLFKHLRRVETREYGTLQTLEETMPERMRKYKEILSDCELTVRPMGWYYTMTDAGESWVKRYYIPLRAT